MHSFDFYTGNQGENNPSSGGGNVVIKLAQSAGMPSGKGCKLFFDNYFTSSTLMKRQ